MIRGITRRLSRAQVLVLTGICCVLVAAAPWWLQMQHDGGDPSACPPLGQRDPSPAASVRNPDVSPSGPEAMRTSIDAAFDFLDRQMDLYHRAMLIQAGPGFSAYYPGGKIGDVDDISAGLDLRDPRAADSTLRIDYRPRRSGGQGWAGLYFLYPDGNWGQSPGRNLSGARKLSFAVCADRDTRAEFLVGGIRDPKLAHPDSLAKISTGAIDVGPQWERHEINLAGRDLSSVIGGFGIATSREPDARPRSLFLSDIAIDLPRLDEPRVVQSYVVGSCAHGGIPSSAETYDQALVLLAFLARGRDDDLRRAELIARALVAAQQQDRTFKDGRLRNAYASGELLDPHSRSARLPGRYDQAEQKYLEDENAAGTDTGNMAWAGLALVQAHAILPKRESDPYLRSASSIATWIVANTKVRDGLGGFAAGLQGFEQSPGVATGQPRKDYRSTEHNIDLEALFDHLAAAVGRDSPDGRSWSAEAAHARMFVDRMQNDVQGSPHFWTGTTRGSEINRSVIPLDAQTWAVLHAREPARYAGALD